MLTLRLGANALFALLTALSTSATLVSLPYITVQGQANYRNSSGIVLSNPVTAYFSIPYAAPPTNDLRFRPPTPPLKHASVLNTTDYGPICLQAGTTTYESSEDCLTLSVFVPGNHTADASGKGLPVVVWIPGGSFNTGGGRTLNVPSLVGNAPDGQDFIGVSINYRLGAFGFLPSLLTHEQNLLNLGFQDITQALQWVQKYVGYFGGDAGRVTAFGESAGAHAVGYQLLHTDAGYTRPFNQVIMDSGGPTARAWPDYNFSLYNTQMEEFLNRTGCSAEASTAVFACLRGKDVGVIHNASTAIFAEYQARLTWAFQAVQDGTFIPRPASESYATGLFQKVNILTGFNTNEGSVFVPKNLNTSSDFVNFFSTLIPYANASILSTISTLYPDPLTNASSPYANSTISPQWSRVSAAYSDYSYIQAVRENAVRSAQWRNPVWKYHFDQVLPATASLGVIHGSELSFVTNSNTDYPELAKSINAYYASFIITGDPNALTPQNATYWPQYSTTDQRQLHLRADGIDVEQDTMRLEQVEFWRSIPGVLTH